MTEKELGYARKYYAKNKEKIQIRAREWARDNRHKVVAYQEKLKAGTLAAYGGRCALCGETNVEFLSIDHVANDGAKHRQELNPNQSTIHIWARRNGYPSSLRCLCMNCNITEFYKFRRKIVPVPSVKAETRKERHKYASILNREKLRRETMAAYGGKCECCEYDKIEALTLDHVNRDGAEFRRNVAGGGHKTYQWVKKNNYPSTFRCLCMNCNVSAHRGKGVCIHHRKPEEDYMI